MNETAIVLYPQGPEQGDIWKRTGGETSKLTNHRSWEENWNHVFYLLGNGGGGKDITVKKLVKEMLEDFPGNNQLKEIYKHIKLNGE